MSTYPTVRLGEICRPRQWTTLSKKDLVADGFPVYGANGKIGFATEFTHAKPTLLIGCRGSCGSVHITEPYSYANGNAMALDDLDEGIAEPRYLYHYFLHRGFRDVITGTSQPQIIQQHLRQVEIPLPPLEEQRRIAAILDKAHSTKRLAIAASDRFESLSLAIFEELFGSSAWPTATLEDVTSRITNGYVGPTRDVYVDEGIPYLLARHVKNGRLSYCGSPKVSATFNEKNKKSKLMEGDVLLVQSGHIGSSCVVPREHDGHNCHAMIVLSPIRDLLLGQYLSLLFRTQRLQRLFKSIQTGITLPHLNCRDVRRIQIPLPPIEKQIWLSERISTLSGGSALAVDQINLISMLERSLTDQLLGSK